MNIELTIKQQAEVPLLDMDKAKPAYYGGNPVRPKKNLRLFTPLVLYRVCFCRIYSMRTDCKKGSENRKHPGNNKRPYTQVLTKSKTLKPLIDQIISQRSSHDKSND